MLRQHGESTIACMFLRRGVVLRCAKHAPRPAGTSPPDDEDVVRKEARDVDGRTVRPPCYSQLPSCMASVPCIAARRAKRLTARKPRTAHMASSRHSVLCGGAPGPRLLSAHPLRVSPVSEAQRVWWRRM